MASIFVKFWTVWTQYTMYPKYRISTISQFNLLVQSWIKGTVKIKHQKINYLIFALILMKVITFRTVKLGYFSQVFQVFSFTHESQSSICFRICRPNVLPSTVVLWYYSQWYFTFLNSLNTSTKSLNMTSRHPLIVPNTSWNRENCQKLIKLCNW